MEQREKLIDICDTCAWENAGCHSAHFHPFDRQICADYKTTLKEGLRINDTERKMEMNKHGTV